MQDGNKLTGKYNGTFGKQNMTNKGESNKVEFRFSIDQGKVVYTGTVKKDIMKGEAEVAVYCVRMAERDRNRNGQSPGAEQVC